MEDTKNQNTNDETAEREMKRMKRITCAAAQIVHLQLMESLTPKIYLASWIVLNALIAEHFAYSLQDTETKEALEMLVEGLKNELNHEENEEK